MRPAVSVLCAVLAASPGLWAQLVDCSAGSEGYKIFLDDVFPSGSSSTDPDTQKLMNRLRAKLKSDFLALKATSPLPLFVIACDGRRPNNETDFRSDLVDALNSRNVLLEVWGNVAPGDRSGADTSIGFMLIPVRKSKELAGIYTTRYASKSANSDRVLQLIGGAPELKAFFEIATGVKAFKEKRYDEAYTSLCNAKVSVGQLRAEGIQTERDSLVNYAQRLAAETVREAAQNTGFQGKLRLIDAGDAAGICRVGK